MPSVSNHPKIKCPAKMRAALAPSQSENGESLAVPIVSRAYRIDNDRLVRPDKQPEIGLGGEYWGEPGSSSLKFEPQVAFSKPSTDIILIGHAHSFGRPSVDVAFRTGDLGRTIRVTGDRYWVKSLGFISMTRPEPFDAIPLIYERAFGGWDRSHPDPEKHAFEPRNPVGTGFRSKHGRFEDGIRLPNLEDPQDQISGYGQRVAPAGFGFTCPDWQPRVQFAGTYDERWMDERMPLLPKDFDRRFFNAASPGLIAPGYLKGDEPVWIENASPRGILSFNLPGLSPPECRVRLIGKRSAVVEMNLDTVIVNTDEDLVLLIWRGFLPVKNGLHDVDSVQIRAVDPPALSAGR